MRWRFWLFAFHTAEGVRLQWLMKYATRRLFALVREHT